MADSAAESVAEDLAANPFNASDPQQVSNARKKAGRYKQRRLDVVKSIMEHRDGRKWFYDLLVSCSVFGNPLVPGDPHYTYFRIGEQNVGKRLLQDINDAAPDKYMEMIKESREVNRE